MDRNGSVQTRAFRDSALATVRVARVQRCSLGRLAILSATRWLCAAVTLLALAGCAVDVRSSLPAPTFIVPSPGAGEWHDIALVSMEFDPPLHTISSIEAARNAHLVAAVDNRGTRREGGVVVTAVLRTVVDGEVKGVQTATIESLAPGEMRVIRFGNIESLPYANQYDVTVRVIPVAGEMSIDNNQGDLRVMVARP